MFLCYFCLAVRHQPWQQLVQEQQNESTFSSNHFPFPLGVSVGLAKVLTSWWGLRGTYRNGKKISPGAEIRAAKADWGENFLSLCLHVNWSLAALQGLSCWAGDLLELSCSLHTWDYQWRQIAEVGQAAATPHPALGQDTARELRTPARAGASHYRSERSTRQLSEIMQLKNWSYETPSWKQRVYLCRRNMYSSGIY